MLFLMLRALVVMLAVWVFWKLYTWLLPRQQAPESPPDDWTEVLEAIKKLPETSDPPASRR